MVIELTKKVKVKSDDFEIIRDMASKLRPMNTDSFCLHELAYQIHLNLKKHDSSTGYIFNVRTYAHILHQVFDKKIAKFIVELYEIEAKKDYYRQSIDIC